MKKILLWFICIPVGLASGSLVLIIYQLLGSKFIEAGSIFHFIESLMGGALSGAAAVYVAAYIAPSRKEWVAVFLSVVTVVAMILVAPTIIKNQEWGYLLFSIAQDVGVIYITYLIFRKKIRFEQKPIALNLDVPPNGVILKANKKIRYEKATTADIALSLIIPGWGFLIGLIALVKKEFNRGLTMIIISGVIIIVFVSYKTMGHKDEDIVKTATSFKVERDVNRSSPAKEDKEINTGGSARDESSWEYKKWRVTSQGSIVRYVTNGNIINGHQFGFIKTKGNCDQDLLWISWSTYEAGIEEFKGRNITFLLRVGDIKFNVEIPLISSFRLTELTTLFNFTNYMVNDNFISLLKKGMKIEVEIILPVEVMKKIDVKSDYFSLNGFVASNLKAKEFCEKLE